VPLCGLLWNCTDTLPGIYWDELKHADPNGTLKSGTYSAAARVIKAALAEAEGVPKLALAGCQD
jgi:hypothetical protein